MDEGLDTGAVALTETVDITPSLTTGELHDKLADVTARLMVEAIARLGTDGLPLAPQSDDGITYAAKIAKTETRVDFSRPAQQVHDHVRGLAPSPGAWFELATGDRAERVKLLTTEVADLDIKGQAPGTVLDDQLTIACGEGAVRLLSLQKAGGKPLVAKDFLRGTPVAPGTVIG
jgi:methionyl-tRNA formyltransferase